MKIAKKISLSYLGESHTDDYLTFSGISYKEAQSLQKLQGEDDADAFIELVKSKFMSGRITDDETHATVDVKVEDIEDLPIDVLTNTVEKLIGGVSENLNKG